MRTFAVAGSILLCVLISVSLASGLPVPVSVTPSSGSGTSQTFSFQYSDVNELSRTANASSMPANLRSRVREIR